MAQIIFNGVTILGPIIIAYLAARVHGNGQRLDRQAEALNRLANGEGDKKIEAKVKAMQADGYIPASAAMIVSSASRTPGTRTRATDAGTTLDDPRTQVVTQE